ncbi:hypothetical protein [Chromobacterium rhizoryzae]|uniref:hypothetical protein n=1 Tax=Chromobacterium rhizoryzae TaxID=1778675 RepID=UPI001D098E47|nr:hypothetical protein [Chromobacterium rhizoryzae]
MRIFHVTSSASAVAIIKRGIFYPASDHPLNNDNGLNCFRYRSGYQMRQNFVGEGARLILEWSGPVVITHPDVSPPLPTDVLHDQYPWRCFIRGGTKFQFLRVLGIHFAKGEIDSVLDFPSWHQFLPAALKNALARRVRLRFLHSLRNKYRNNSLFLVVIG